MSREAVDQGHAKFLAAMKGNDPAAFGRIVAQDAVFMPPYEPNLVGTKGVVDWFGQVVKQAHTTDITVSNRHVVLSGDWAIERGVFLWTMAIVGGGNTIENRGNFLAVWRRDPDGTWKIVHNIWNSLVPLKDS